MSEFIESLQSQKIAPVCIRCGSFFRNRSMFCRTCFKNYILKFKKFDCSLSDSNLEIVTLFRWISQSSDSLSQAIHLLKMPEAKQAWKFYGELFSQSILNSRKLDSLALVPVPGRSENSTHTQYFADVIGNKLEVKVVNLLSLESKDVTLSTVQKQLTRKQRLSRQFDFNVDFTRLGELGKIKNIVLIDDVITTGATLNACAQQIRAVKPQIDLQAWVLFQRL